MLLKRHTRTTILSGIVTITLIVLGSGCTSGTLSDDGPDDSIDATLPSSPTDDDGVDTVTSELPPPSVAISDTDGATEIVQMTEEGDEESAIAVTIEEQATATIDIAGELSLTGTVTATLSAAITITTSTKEAISSTPTITAAASPSVAVPLSPTSSLEGTLNGIPVKNLVDLSDEVRRHVRQIFIQGQRLGRDAHAFSRLGASIVATRHFMGRFDTGPYDMGPYADLEPTIEHFSGSFSRVGLAAMRGLTAWAVFDPAWSNPEECLPNESPIDCELRVHNPAVILIVLGTNDKWDAAEFDENLRKVVDYAIDKGVVPVLATKADRFEGPDNRNNIIIRQVAADYAVPLWDFDLLAETLPARGMGADDVHLTLFDYYDYNMPVAYETGYGMYNLSALMMLHALWLELSQIQH